MASVRDTSKMPRSSSIAGSAALESPVAGASQASKAAKAEFVAELYHLQQPRVLLLHRQNFH